MQRDQRSINVTRQIMYRQQTGKPNTTYYKTYEDLKDSLNAIEEEQRRYIQMGDAAKANILETTTKPHILNILKEKLKAIVQFR